MASLRSVAAAALLVGLTACSGGGSPSVAGQTSTTGPAPTTTVPAAAATTTTTPVPAAWHARAAAPTSRQEVASAVLDGRVWVIGGITTAGASAVVESYDPAADKWYPGPALPLALHHSAATVYRGEIVVAGGFVADPGDLYARASDRVLALRNGAWTDLPRLRRPRGAAAAAVVGNALVVAGGRDSAALIGPTEVFDGAAWRDGAALPTRRDHLSAVSDGRSVYTVGGRFLSPGAISAAFERYDPTTDVWERLPAMTTARAGQGAALVGGRVVVAGGEDPSRVYGEVEAYDIAREAWSALPSLPTPRHGLALERVGSQLLALVGGTSSGVAPSTRAEALEPVS
jgi:non-specific serine/threonine protein kinase